MRSFNERSSINPFNLHFKNGNLEKEFINKRWDKLRESQKTYVVFIIVLAAYLLSVSLIRNMNVESVKIPCSVIALLVTMMWTAWRTTRLVYSDFLVFLANSAISIVAVESNRNLADLPCTKGSLAAISFGLISSSFFKAGTNFFYSILNQVFLLIYSTARTCSVFGEEEWLIWPCFLLGSLMLMFNYYCDEKIERENFVEYKENLKRQKIWKFILDEVYPQSTFLINSEDFFGNSEEPIYSSGFRHDKGPSILKKLSTFFFEKERSLIRRSLSWKKSPSVSFKDHLKQSSLGQEGKEHSLDLDYSPSKVSKNKLRVNTAEDMYNFLSNIEVKNIIFPSGYEPRGMASMKLLSEVIEYLFRDTSHGPRLTLQNISTGVRSPLSSTENDKKNFKFSYIYERTKKIEHKSILIKGLLTTPSELPDGDVLKIPVNLKLCKFKWDKKPWVIIFFQDVSDYEENKHLKELDKLKDKLLASVTHDLRTPLNMVLGTN